MEESSGAGRPTRVLVAVRRDVVAVPWDSRDRLLDRLRDRDDGDEAIAAFEAVDADRPVELDVLNQIAVVETIRAMEADGPLADGLQDLLAALVDELHEHE